MRGPGLGGAACGRCSRGPPGSCRRTSLVPDPQITWVPGAFLKGLSLIRKERPAVIYSSSPPNSCQVLGLMLKRVTHVPWIADFRDPWTEGIRRKQSYERSGVRRRLEHAFERRVIESADHIIVTTEKTLEQFLAKYPAIPSSKYSVITNGFDAADFTVTRDGDRLLDDEPFQRDAHRQRRDDVRRGAVPHRGQGSPR